MLKFDIEYLKFEDLKDGDVFLIQREDYIWYGMKVSETCGWEENKSYILDMSECVGTLYDDVDMYDIIGLVDVKVVVDKGGE
jgi:hypothetical protein